MLSRTNNYIAAMHTFEYGRFKGTFLQNHFSEKALRPIITGEHISRQKGKKNLSNIWQWRRRFVIFT